jgi:hypothetical protein
LSNGVKLAGLTSARSTRGLAQNGAASQSAAGIALVLFLLPAPIACITILAGPIEATAIGNLLVQALTCGSLAALGDGRRAIARTAALAPRRFDPQRSREWKEAAARYRELELASAAP